MSAYMRAKAMGIQPTDDNGIELCREKVKTYLTTSVAGDTRRLMWLYEEAAEHAAEELNDIELRIVSALKFCEADAYDLTAKRQRLLEDFEFLYCVSALIKLAYIEKSAKEAMDSIFGERRKPSK